MVTEPPGSSGRNGSNGANGDDGATIGYVRGDFNQYIFSSDASLGEKYKVALAFLNAGAAGNASRLIQSLVEESFRGDAQFSANHICYHWILATLSGRSFDQLNSGDHQIIDMTKGMSDASRPDAELGAYMVIQKLIDCIKTYEQTGRPDPRLDSLYEDYQGLLPQHRADFRRHLDPLLDEAQADKLEARFTAEASQERMANGRRRRAWKFFQPTPEPPRLQTVEDPIFEFGQWVLTCSAVAIGVGGMVLAVAILQAAGVIRAAIVASVILASAVITPRFAILYLTARECLVAKEREHGRPHHLSRYSSPVPEYDDSELSDDELDDDAVDLTRQARLRRRKFVKGLLRHVDLQFSRLGPRGRAARRRWLAGTAGLKATLVNEILTQYSDSELQIGAVDWLVRWRIRRIARRWRAGNFDAYREEFRPRLEIELALAGGSLTLAAALIYAVIVIAQVRSAYAALIVVAWLLAGLVGALSKVDVCIVQRRLAKAERERIQIRYEEEQREFARWKDLLADRPNDEEVLRWLASDMNYLKNLAMTQLGLARRDILSYATLTEPAPGSVGMREPLIPRYSRYRATVFLLTQEGVRQVTVVLDFTTGDAYNQERRSFRHNAITSAIVLETGIRFDAGPRQPAYTHSHWDHGQHHLTAKPQESAPRRRPTSLILQQRFRLGLANGDVIPFLVQNVDTNAFDGITEDPAMLLDVALDTSGISGALELLEAISGHGTQWVAQRLRSRRPPTDAGIHIGHSGG